MPAFGQWMTPDPLADNYPAFSPYTYVLDSPTNYVDLMGLCPEGVSGGEWFEDESGNSILCLGRVTVTAERPETAGMPFLVGNTLYLPEPSGEGQQAQLTSYFRSRPRLAGRVLSSSQFGAATRKAAFMGSYYAGMHHVPAWDNVCLWSFTIHTPLWISR